MKRSLAPIALVCLGLWLPSCQYLPFLKYFGTDKKTDLPRFKDRDYFKGSAHSLRTSYDLIEYDWLVSVDPGKKSLSSTMKIQLRALTPSDSILLDLHDKLEINQLTSTRSLSGWKHKDDLLYLVFDQAMSPGELIDLSISYSGKPLTLAKEGPIQWKESNGIPWISTQTQGIGAHRMMPCKELLYDEPERCFIRVEVPSHLVAVANGKLDSITEEASTRVFHHSVLNPINIYNISFNIGDFVKIEKPYQDILGQDRVIQIHALRNFADTLSVFYDQTPAVLTELENLFGPFPWWRDGCKIVQSTLGRSAMEHQSAISMGSIMRNDYQVREKIHTNTTLSHELAHEWWGNMVSAKDFCDIWLHEGFATYSESLVIEKLYGEKYYNYSINRMSRFVFNERPLIKECGVRYSSWVSSKDYDIYNKGALVLHTVRKQLANDPLFFEALRATLGEFRLRNLTTTDFVTFFNQKTGQDFTGLFDFYLKNPKPPKLIYSYDSAASQLTYRWASEAADKLNLTVKARSLDSLLVSIDPSTTDQTITMAKGKDPVLRVSDFGYVILSQEAKTK